MMVYIYLLQLFQIITQSLDAIDVTSVTLSCLNNIQGLLQHHEGLLQHHGGVLQFVSQEGGGRHHSCTWPPALSHTVISIETFIEYS